MKKFLSILLFLPLVFPGNLLGEVPVAQSSGETAVIKATNAERTTSTHPLNKARSLAAHNNAEGDVSTSNFLSFCNTIDDLQEDIFEDLFAEDFVHIHTAILLSVSDFIEPSPRIWTLIFPFHFFL